MTTFHACTSFKELSCIDRNDRAALVPTLSNLLWCAALIVSGLTIQDSVGAEAAIDFTKDIQPLLANKCFRCHGPDDQAREADLRLDSFDAATAKTENDIVPIVPGSTDESELWLRVSSNDPDYRMPPEGTSKALDAVEQKKIQQWILQGAKYDRHWSFVAPVRPKLPTNAATDYRPGNAIDIFVLARLQTENLLPAEPADRYILVRRVYLDLTGLPPTLNEVDDFVADVSPDAYERVVDRILESPAYGERWARVWLDLARYADSAGYAQDPLRNIWRYRDWVIDAINANKPFDQFTVEQLAGDLLPSPTDNQLLATAFHRNTMTNSEGGTDDEEFRNAAVIDRVNTTMQVWMGLTMGCAQCHTHKYDPISQDEYFRFFAVFNNTEDADRGDETPLLTEYPKDQEKQRADLQEQKQSLEQKLATATSDHEALKTQIKTVDKEIDKLANFTTPILRELPKDKQRVTHIQVRGNFAQLGDQVTPGIPSAFHQLPDDMEPDRLDIAQWLISKENPLTARVIVNRFWEQLFGTGIVETSEDFGIQGSAPSHPLLLDYLATELMRLNWDTKQLVRLIVTSSTYRQSSKVSERLAQIDPRNRLLARGPRFRLSAEMIRDQALSIAGLLSRKMNGPSVQPPRPRLGLNSAFGGSTDWEPSQGEDRFRRGFYTSWRRTTPYPSMTTFDAPSREVCTIRRVPTNTPLQALVTLNDPVYIEAAQGLARRIVTRGLQDRRDQLAFGWRLCLARHATTNELDRLDALFHEVYQKYSAKPDEASELTNSELLAEVTLDKTELATWTMIANVLLNLDEVIARP